MPQWYKNTQHYLTVKLNAVECIGLVQTGWIIINTNYGIYIIVPLKCIDVNDPQRKGLGFAQNAFHVVK